MRLSRCLAVVAHLTATILAEIDINSDCDKHAHLFPDNASYFSHFTPAHALLAIGAYAEKQSRKAQQAVRSHIGKIYRCIEDGGIGQK